MGDGPLGTRRRENLENDFGISRGDLDPSDDLEGVPSWAVGPRCGRGKQAFPAFTFPYFALNKMPFLPGRLGTKEHVCPECGRPMTLIRVLPKLDDHPPLGAYLCEPCELAETVPMLRRDGGRSASSPQS